MTLDAAQSIGPKPSRVTLEIPADNLCFILGAALAFRIWLLYYADNISSVLSTRVELTNGFIGLHYSIISPFFRNRDLREPLVREVGYLLKMGVSAYDFGTCLPVRLQRPRTTTYLVPDALGRVCRRVFWLARMGVGPAARAGFGRGLLSLSDCATQVCRPIADPQGCCCSVQALAPSDSDDDGDELMRLDTS